MRPRSLPSPGESWYLVSLLFCSSIPPPFHRGGGGGEHRGRRSRTPQVPWGDTCAPTPKEFETNSGGNFAVSRAVSWFFLPCGRRGGLLPEGFVSQMTAEGTRVCHKASKAVSHHPLSTNAGPTKVRNISGVCAGGDRPQPTPPGIPFVSSGVL